MEEQDCNCILFELDLNLNYEYQLPSKNLEQKKNGSAQARAPPNPNDQGVFNPISNDQNGLRTKSYFVRRTLGQTCLSVPHGERGRLRRLWVVVSPVLPASCV